MTNRLATLTNLVEAAKRATPYHVERIIKHLQHCIDNFYGTETVPHFNWAEWKDIQSALALANPAAILELGRAWDEMKTALEQSQRDLEAARKALKPFADFIAGNAGKSLPDNFPISQGSSMAKKQITASDLRAAAKELEGET